MSKENILDSIGLAKDLLLEDTWSRPQSDSDNAGQAGMGKNQTNDVIYLILESPEEALEKKTKAIGYRD